jgi:hypothetical protein
MGKKNVVGDVLCPPGSRGEAMEQELSDKVDRYNKGIYCPLCNRHIQGADWVWPFPMFEIVKGPSISFKAIVERRFGRKAARNSPILRKSRRLRSLKAKIIRLAKEYDRVLKASPNMPGWSWEEPASQ